MKDFFLYYLAIINVATALLSAWDKRASKHSKARISETTLLLLAALGGSLGLYLSMYMLRHKTKHAKFFLGVPAILLIQLALIWYYYTQL
jgi:uncharacterized membrane protein YsdA (DUF1294 family)